MVVSPNMKCCLSLENGINKPDLAGPNLFPRIKLGHAHSHYRVGGGRDRLIDSERERERGGVMGNSQNIRYRCKDI